MRLLPSLFILLFLLAFLTCSLHKEISITGKWESDDFYKGCVLIFNKDQTFKYKYKGEVFTDTSSGVYQINVDTISLRYTDSYDSIIASYNNINTKLPIDLQLTLGRLLLSRPSKILFRGRKLYYISNSDPATKIKSHEVSRTIFMRKVK
jgi:hypothetical protein